MQRRHFKQTLSLEDRLLLQAEEIKKRADGLPPGIEREKLPWKAKNADTAAHINDWLSSPGLQSPNNGDETFSSVGIWNWRAVLRLSAISNHGAPA